MSTFFSSDDGTDVTTPRRAGAGGAARSSKLFPRALRVEIARYWDAYLSGDETARTRIETAPAFARYSVPWQEALRSCFDILDGWQALTGGAAESRTRVMDVLFEGLVEAEQMLAEATDGPAHQTIAADMEAYALIPAAGFVELTPDILQRMATEIPEMAPAANALRAAIRMMARTETEMAGDPPSEAGDPASIPVRFGVRIAIPRTPLPPEPASDDWMDAFGEDAPRPVGPSIVRGSAVSAEGEAPGHTAEDSMVEQLPDDMLDMVLALETEEADDEAMEDAPTVSAPPDVFEADDEPLYITADRADAVQALVLRRWKISLGARVQEWEKQHLRDFLARLAVDMLRKQETVKRLQALLGVQLEYLGIGGTWGAGVWQERSWGYLEEYVKLAESNPAVQRLAELLGRYEAERVQQELLRAPTPLEHRPRVLLRSGGEEVRGVRQSGDISRLTTGELVSLGDPDLEILFYMRLLDQQLLTYDYAGAQEHGYGEINEAPVPARRVDRKGPIILCIDTSASMAGEPELVAKTISLALLRIAIRERRPCWAISYSHTQDLRQVELTRFPDSLGDLVQFLSMSFRGGTDPVPALQAAFARLETAAFDRADILWVTDGVFEVPEAFERHLREVRAEKNVRIHTLLVGEAVVPDFVDFCWEWTEGRSFATGGVELVYGLSDASRHAPAAK